MKNSIVNNKNFKIFSVTKHVLRCMILLTVCIAVSSVAFAETITIEKDSNCVKVATSGSDSCILDVTIGNFERKEVMINGEKYFSISSSVKYTYNFSNMI